MSHTTIMTHDVNKFEVKKSIRADGSGKKYAVFNIEVRSGKRGDDILEISLFSENKDFEMVRLEDCAMINNGYNSKSPELEDGTRD